MGHVVNIFTGIAGMHANDLRVGGRLQLFGASGTNKYLGCRNQARKVDEPAERCDLGYCFNGTLSEDGKETWTGNGSACAQQMNIAEAMWKTYQRYRAGSPGYY
jgi:hypothetical protein